jgi:hypothetical protein
VRGGSLMGVAYDDGTGTWQLSLLRSWTIRGVLRQEPCPVLVERKDVIKGLNTWMFLGSFVMPFELRLTRR